MPTNFLEMRNRVKSAAELDRHGFPPAQQMTMIDLAIARCIIQGVPEYKARYYIALDFSFSGRSWAPAWQPGQCRTYVKCVTYHLIDPPKTFFTLRVTP